MFILLRRQTHSSFFWNYARLLRRFTHSSIATKYFDTIIKHVFFLKRSLVSRFFHFSLIYNSNCDFDSSCVCSECTQVERESICEVCRVRSIVHQSYKDSYDWKDIRFYSFTSFCEQCWQKCEKTKREKEKKKKQILTLNKARMNSMMKIVQKIHSTEQTSIARVIDKLVSEITSVKNVSNSRRWFQRHLIDYLFQELQVVKIWNKYMCNKQRVDAINYKLWYFAKRSYYETWNF